MVFVGKNLCPARWLSCGEFVGKNLRSAGLSRASASWHEPVSRKSSVLTSVGWGGVWEAGSLVRTFV